METVVQQIILTTISSVVLFAVGFFAKSITGENRASVRKTMTEALGNDAGAANSYMEVAQKAAKMMGELQAEVKELKERDEKRDKEVDDLRARVETLERENEAKDKKILALEIENAALRKNQERGHGGLATK